MSELPHARQPQMMQLHDRQTMCSIDVLNKQPGEPDTADITNALVSQQLPVLFVLHEIHLNITVHKM